MVKSLKLDQKRLDRLVQNLNSIGEMIRARQDEKQSVIDDYEAERKRFKSGKISKATLMSSKNKTNKELMRLDKNIRDAMSKARNTEETMRKLISKQAPKVVRATESGIGLKKSGGKKKTSSKKTAKTKPTPSKKKVSPKVLQKEKSLDRKYQKKKK
ncbi:MAG TPA: hypothetical protein VJ912_03235 [Candidatus Nanoarchaeia archaeon]|nr:hypothetical protein [Candidatus Nanoarchaeia archaeon]